MSPAPDRPAAPSDSARLRAVLIVLPTPVVATDREGRIDFVNAAAAAILRRDPASLQGQRLPDTLHLVDDRHRPLELARLQARLLEEGVALRVHHATLVQPDGNEVAVSCAAEPLRDPGGDLAGSVWVVHDVREERQVRHHLSIEARHDPLTGLVNRKELERRLQRAVAGAARAGGHHALCFLDLDRFKPVNDRYGHAAGDAVLAELAGLLLSRIRGRDTLARLGGDEFALLLEHCPIEEAGRLAQTLVAAVAEHRFAWQGDALAVGLSAGVAPITGDEQASAVLGAADAACYRAKALGRGRVFVVTPAPAP